MSIIDFQIEQLGFRINNLTIGILALYDRYNNVPAKAQPALEPLKMRLNALYEQFTRLQQVFANLLNDLVNDPIKLASGYGAVQQQTASLLQDEMAAIGVALGQATGAPIVLAQKQEPSGVESMLWTAAKYGLMLMGVWFGGKFIFSFIESRKNARLKA